MSTDESRLGLLDTSESAEEPSGTKPAADKPARPRRKRGGGRSRKARAAETVKVPVVEEPVDTELPETKLVLELDIASINAEPMLSIDTVFSESQQVFSASEVTAEIEPVEEHVPQVESVTENVDETIALDEPDELLDEVVSEPQQASVPSRGVTPPPHPHKNPPQQPSPISSPGAQYWWERFFNDDYLRSVRPLTQKQVRRQSDFIESRLSLKPHASILDVGCGLGSHAVELASRGYSVVGLDISLPMLSRASEEAQDREQRLNFLHADMRELSFESAFDAVLCWGTSFGYFDDETNRQVIERLYRTLKPRGRMMLGIVNRDFVVRSQPNVVWFEGDGCLCMEETSFDYIGSRLNVKRTLLMEDGRQRESGYSVRLYTLQEIGQLLHHQGFRVEEVSGSEAIPGVFFGADSPQMLILAERRANTSFPNNGVDPDWEDDTFSPSRPTLVDPTPRFDEEDEVTRVEREV